MPTFGKRSNQRPAGGGGSSFELFLKTFKDPQTRIRILEDDPDTWVEIREHFDNGLKISFPCAKHEGADACIGCDYPVEHPEWEDTDTHFPGLNFSKAKEERKKLDKGWGVRDSSSKWIFPAIDPKGYVSVYKIGYNLWDSFKNLRSVVGSLTATEVVVVRSGSGFSDTNYTPTAVPGEVREPKAAIPNEQVISSILGKKYLYAMEKYGMEVPEQEEAAQPDPAPATEPAGDEAQQGEQWSPHEPGDDNAWAKEEEARKAAPDTGKAAAPATEPMFIPREASIGEIKDWLTQHEVEYPPKGARQVLVGLAEKKLTELAN